VIRECKSCKIHPSKRKRENLELGVVWLFLNEGRNLNGNHGSLTNDKAQTDVIVHKHFHKFIYRSKSIQRIDKLFSKKDQNEINKAIESVREVPIPWR